MLSKEERSLVERMWSLGPSVLIDAGYTTEEIRLFLGRPDVQAQLALEDEEFKHKDVISARARHVNSRNLSKLAEGAAGVLARALAGPQYARNPETGSILKDASGHPIVKVAEMTAQQVRAAQTILDRVGTTDPKVRIDLHGKDGFNLSVMVETQAAAPTIQLDPTHTTIEEKALSRERIRNVIFELSEKLPEIRAKVAKGLGIAAPGETPPKKVEAKKPPGPKKPSAPRPPVVKKPISKKPVAKKPVKKVSKKVSKSGS